MRAFRIGLLALPLLTFFVGAAGAGVTKAAFHVGIRIDAGLIERDRARTRTHEAVSRKPARPAPRTLPRADGSGLCTRVRVAPGRFHWRCR